MYLLKAPWVLVCLFNTRLINQKCHIESSKSQFLPISTKRFCFGYRSNESIKIFFSTNYKTRCPHQSTEYMKLSSKIALEKTDNHYAKLKFRLFYYSKRINVQPLPSRTKWTSKILSSCSETCPYFLNLQTKTTDYLRFHGETQLLISLVKLYRLYNTR